MSKTVHIESDSHLDTVLSSSKIVVTDFWAEWCGPCKAIAPVYEQLSSKLSRPQKVTFTKVDTEKQKEIATKYQITALPTFMVFKNGQIVDTVKGAKQQELVSVLQKIAAEADSDSGAGGYGESSSSGGASWRGASLPRGYKDITDQVDLRGLDLLNADSDFSDARGLFASSKPQTLAAAGKGKAKEEDGNGDGSVKDWVESDTDEQLMLYMPFQSTLKVHTIHITSLPPAEGEEPPMRPKTLHVYSNRAHVLGFEEAEGTPPTQAVEIGPGDWDKETGTAKVELRFVKFQNVTSLVLFVVNGDGEGDKVRVDRLRIVGESGEKREMGKLEKIGEGGGE